MKNKFKILKDVNYVIHGIKKGEEGIPDKLICKCPLCNRIPEIDYHVSDTLWGTVVPKKYKLGVICLDCFAKLAKKKHILFEWIIPQIEKIFYATEDYTIELMVEDIYDLEKRINE